MQRLFLFATLIVGLVVGAVLPGGRVGASLAPSQILVVVNGNDPDSLAIGQYYCQQRGVPRANIFQLNCTASETISTDEYVEKMVAPLREALVRGELDKTIRCLLLVRGVPLRIDEPVDGKDLTDWLRTFQTKSASQLAVDLEYLKLIGTQFPNQALIATYTNPPAQMFNGPVPKPAGTDSLEALRAQVIGTIQDKADEIKKMPADDNQTIAARQLRSLIYDTTGITGIMGSATNRQVPALPGDDTLDQLRQKWTDANVAFTRLQKVAPNEAKTRDDLEQAIRNAQGVVGLSVFGAEKLRILDRTEGRLAVDSDLVLVTWNRWALVKQNPEQAQGYYHLTPQNRGSPNPLHWSCRDRLAELQTRPNAGKVMMVCRIDGPAAKDCRRLIDDSIRVEKTGLKGTLYVDAGGPDKEIDKHLDALAQQTKAQTSIPVVLNDKPAVFSEGTCPDAALYVGWLSPKYIAAFKFDPGAIGYHIAGDQVTELHVPESKQWVPSLIRDGVAATIGATDEPFTAAYPPADDFFSVLMSGKVTLAEAYWMVSPQVGWRMILIGDPLYKPFGANPQPVKLGEGMLP